ncbi:hypothetical protein IT402_00915 [Candidatus Nomurabacteria bacterium]|nr:hypothetical protein [Candidatus Nomurabacteria bacterium]
MKKLIVFLVVIGLIFFGYFKTDGFTYLNGDLSRNFTGLLMVVAIVTSIIAFCYLVSGLKFFKKAINDMPITPFEKE